VSPSGRLVHTLAKNQTDYEHFAISEASDIEFSEGNHIDYKYFDQQNKTVEYEFGFGPSYTTFTYGSNLSITPNTALLSHAYAIGAHSVGGRKDLWDTVATLSTSLTNTGAEVAQLYVEFPATANEPVRQLRGFKKVMIQPRETEKVSFELRRRDLSIWDVMKQEWKVERGEYKMHVGASSRDLRVAGTMTV
jgi:beta-glucosidase